MSVQHDPAAAAMYTLSLHDALPIWLPSLSSTSRSKKAPITGCRCLGCRDLNLAVITTWRKQWTRTDRKSTRLNSSHLVISYAVFCLNKKRRGKKPCRLWRTKDDKRL